MSDVTSQDSSRADPLAAYRRKSIEKAQKPPLEKTRLSTQSRQKPLEILSYKGNQDNSSLDFNDISENYERESFVIAQTPENIDILRVIPLIGTKRIRREHNQSYDYPSKNNYLPVIKKRNLPSQNTSICDLSGFSENGSMNLNIRNSVNSRIRSPLEKCVSKVPDAYGRTKEPQIELQPIQNRLSLNPRKSMKVKQNICDLSSLTDQIDIKSPRESANYNTRVSSILRQRPPQVSDSQNPTQDVDIQLIRPMQNQINLALRKAKRQKRDICNLSRCSNESLDNKSSTKTEAPNRNILRLHKQNKERSAQIPAKPRQNKIASNEPTSIVKKSSTKIPSARKSQSREPPVSQNPPIQDLNELIKSRPVQKYAIETALEKAVAHQSTWKGRYAGEMVQRARKRKLIQWLPHSLGHPSAES